ncbi:gamma-parvin-like [Panthera uncia]|uniref:gamma-parvin-like n=1 Tax=Panthera uncia TaxID=29064 RepID=UPI0020FFF223|nr:gamma-parvin-like [Panthera uncia]
MPLAITAFPTRGGLLEWWAGLVLGDQHLGGGSLILPTSGGVLSQLHNVTLALELLKDEGLLSYPINPEDIVNKDTKSTLRVLYSLFRKHKLKENADSTPRGSPN